MTTTYTVRPQRWDHGYELHIAGLGVTQVDEISDAEDAARDFIALDLDVPEDSFSVVVESEGVELPPNVALVDLEDWEQRIWLTPGLSVEERSVAIAIVRVSRGEIELESGEKMLNLLRRAG